MKFRKKISVTWFNGLESEESIGRDDRTTSTDRNSMNMCILRSMNSSAEKAAGKK